MWNKPQLMTAVADLLFVAGAAGLLVAAVLWGARLPWFPVRDIVVMHELREVRRSELEDALTGRLRGNFFSVNLDAVRQSLEELPWIRHAEVRRQWPSRIEITLEEHVPVAHWGQNGGQLVNSHGEVFAATMSTPEEKPMPTLTGPADLAPELLGYLREAEEMLKPTGRSPQHLVLSPRLALQIRLDDGMVVELGREQTKAPVHQRLERFVEHYASLLTIARQKPTTVDMRYPNGFALRLAAAAATENKGKP